jgi:hypothetical protein
MIPTITSTSTFSKIRSNRMQIEKQSYIKMFFIILLAALTTWQAFASDDMAKPVQAGPGGITLDGAPFTIKASTFSEESTFVSLFPTKEDIEISAGMGLNTVNLLLDPDDFIGSRSMTSGYRERFRFIDRVVAICKKTGMYLMLTMQEPMVRDEGPGYPSLYNDPWHQNRFIELWTEIARRYADEATVIGYNLFIEPEPDLPVQWSDLAGRLLGSIRTVDTASIVFIAGVQKLRDKNTTRFSNPLFPEIDTAASNVVFTAEFDRPRPLYGFGMHEDKRDMGRFTYYPQSDRPEFEGVSSSRQIMIGTTTLMNGVKQVWNSDPFTYRGSQPAAAFPLIRIPGEVEYDSADLLAFEILQTLDGETSTIWTSSADTHEQWIDPSGAGGKLDFEYSNDYKEIFHVIIGDDASGTTFVNRVRPFDVTPGATYRVRISYNVSSYKDPIQISAGLELFSYETRYDGWNAEYLDGTISEWLNAAGNIPLLLDRMGDNRFLYSTDPGLGGETWLADILDSCSKRSVSYSLIKYNLVEQ